MFHNDIASLAQARSAAPIHSLSVAAARFSSLVQEYYESSFERTYFVTAELTVYPLLP